MIEEKEIDVDGHNYILSKIPGMQAREIFTQYLPSAVGKERYKYNEELSKKILSYVQVNIKMDNGSTKQVSLESEGLINKHVKAGDSRDSWQNIMFLEYAMAEYNCTFLKNGGASGLLDQLGSLVKAGATKILTDSLGQLFPKDEPPSTS